MIWYGNFRDRIPLVSRVDLDPSKTNLTHLNPLEDACTNSQILEKHGKPSSDEKLDLFLVRKGSSEAALVKYKGKNTMTSVKKYMFMGSILLNSVLKS